MPDSPTTRARVDDTRERTVSVASRGTRAQHHPAVERQLVPVGPGRPSAAIVPRSDALRDEVDEVRGYPIDLAKVQRPALRDETLERPRLLDWLKTKVNGRVVLVLADAGYGKTTLLADFSRRTRMRTLWYRLDEEDRDWRSFFHHLVAAGREYDPSFAPKTAELLADVSVGGPTRESVLDAFLRELPSIAASGAILILDDYHLVDDAPDARFITRELVQGAPDRVSIVFASRRAPSVPLAKLRAVGDVAELGTDDLRFDLRETEQLFSETYGRPLDPDVLADLSTRTEGWILSLQLVQAAIRDRNPTEIRRFVRGLTGADRDLYDYLAEEVVGDLAPEMQRFLMETSILQIVTPPFAEVVTGIPAAEVGTLIAAAERLTLLSRVSGGPRTHQRYHPLVREFLEARLRSIEGDAAVAELHRRTAARLASADWRIGAHHYREAADTPGLLGVIEAAIPTIMGNGQYALADAYIRPVPADLRPSGLDLILSRVDMQHGDYDAGIAASQAVLDAAGDDPVQRDHALLNLLALYFNFGNGEKARYFARELSKSTADPNLRGIADATSDILLAADDGDINDTVRRLTLLATEQRDGRPHHYGVSMFNLAGCSLVQDRLDEGLRQVDSCLDSLEQTSSGIERVAAGVLRGSILMRLGRAAEADQQIGSVLSGENEHLEDDALIDAAEAYTSFGNPDRARMLLDRLGTRAPRTLVARRHLANAQTGMFLREGKFAEATTAFANYPAGLGTDVGGGAQRLVIGACLALMSHASDGQDRAAAAVRHASEQNAHSWRRLAELLYAASSGASDLGDAIGVTGQQTPWHLTYLADVIIPVLDQLNPDAQAMVKRAADLHPDKWRFCLRGYLTRADTSNVIHQARLLEQIGERSDIPRLRAIGRSVRRGAAGSEVGRALIRRLAPPVFVEDQGRVRLRIGPREVAASEIRRKVLALVCFLLTRVDLSATRDQVLDAIWPDLDPDLAQNSLNQTLYFLRRVLEEAYSDDLSPGYVRHDSDVIWLDPQLVTSRSRVCRDLIHSLGGKPSPEGVERLVSAYHGRFALDFEYEEWAGAFRDSLHAAYLEIVERAVAEDSATGHFDRGIVIARKALEVDPSAEQIEVSLLRMYRSSGAHAAAAEQYAHYATVMRNELGLEPPPLESL